MFNISRGQRHFFVSIPQYLLWVQLIRPSIGIADGRRRPSFIN